jgi:hypothetical protein
MQRGGCSTGSHRALNLAIPLSSTASAMMSRWISFDPPLKAD